MKLECPQCGDLLTVGDRADTVSCCCGSVFDVDRDADFVGGLWQDRTTLVPVPTPQERDADRAQDGAVDQEAN